MRGAFVTPPAGEEAVPATPESMSEAGSGSFEGLDETPRDLRGSPQVVFRPVGQERLVQGASGLLRTPVARGADPGGAHQNRPTVPRVGGAVDQSQVLQPPDLSGHR